MRSVLSSAVVCAFAFTSLLQPQIAAFAQESSAAEETPEDARARKIMERFLKILKGQPRFGTSLDRVYGYHVERGTLEAFVKSLRDAVEKDPEDGTSWMLLGLMELQRGHDAQAVQTLKIAEKTRSDDPLASYYLGRALVLTGDPTEASQAFERAIERKPQRNDLLQIFQTLGRVHQRAQRTKEALAVWDRLEKLFPDDLRVQEQIATILADEDDHEGALKRYQTLSSKTKDRYRQVTYGIKAAELKIRLGKKDEAVADFEKMLAGLKPTSWLHRDVRQKIETVYLKADDYDGLSKYYDQWLTKNPDDLDAMSRLGRTLAFQGRLPEATVWFEKAIKRAPSDTKLRKSFIDQLIQGKRFAQAIAQYEQLEKIDPGNPDNIHEWGQLILEDKSLSEDEKKKRAGDVWRKLITARPKDPVIAGQVADLFRHAKMTDEAIELYKKSIELSPEDPQYREYLGEYYHVLERPENAIATWKVIAEGKKRNTRNLVRLAEVFHGFGYREESVDTMASAIKLEPEFTDHVRFAQMQRDLDKYEDALKTLDVAEGEAEDEEESQLVLTEQIRTWQFAGKLGEEITKREESLGDTPTSDQLQTLAQLYEADRRMDQASQSAKQSLAIDPENIQAWTVATRIYEAAGMINDAVASNRKLASLDRRSRTAYLQKIATLEMRLGRIDEALKAGRDLIAAAPGNTEHYRFFADLNFQAGKHDEGLDALRRAVRANPADPSALMGLAAALSEQFRTDESLELYWRAFDKSDDLDGRVGLVNTMTELYLRTNHFDRLVEKLRRLGKELNAERDMTLCLAAAHRAAGDLGTAREVLEELVSEETKDTQLFSQLTQLAEAESDFELAARYQRQINEIAPTREGDQKLAQYLLKTGDIDEAEVAWMRIAEGEREPHRLLAAIDSLITNDKFDTATKIVDRRLRENPRDWEALYRSGVILWKQSQKAESASRFESILALTVPFDEFGEKAKYQAEQAKKRAAGKTSSTSQTFGMVNSYGAPVGYPRVLLRSRAVYEIQRTLELNPNRGYSNRQMAWNPNDFGEARIAAIAVLYTHAESEGKGQEFVKRYEERAQFTGNRIPPAAWDSYFLTAYTMQQGRDYSKMYELTKRLSKSRDPAAMLLFLQTVPQRNYRPGINYEEALKTAKPLTDEELDHLVYCHEEVKKRFPVFQTNFASSQILISEFKLAKKGEKAEELYADALAGANNAQSTYTIMNMAASLGKTEDAITLARKLGKLSSHTSAQNNYFTSSYYSFMQLMAKLSEEKKYDAVRSLLDVYLDVRADMFASLPAHRRGNSPNSNSSNFYVQVYQSSHSMTSTQISYPRPNALYDQGMISLLYNTWMFHKKAGNIDELLAHLEGRIETLEPSAVPFVRLALCYVNWWQDDRQASLDQLELAQAAAPDILALRLEVAAMYRQYGDHAGALKLLDAIQPSNHNILKQRELLALSAAVSIGDINRARKASERLFGLQLDTNTQMQLAQQMHQLGMHEMAEGVLARMRRRSGGQTSTLVQLMNQYQTQGKSDTAVQIARQIMRRTKPNTSSSSRTAEDSYRQAAVQILANTGQLDELVDRVKAQIEKSPKSIKLHQLLAEYLRAAGKTDEAQEVISKITDLNPNDAKSLYALGQQLYRSRDYAGACDTYMKAMKLDPTHLTQDFYNVYNAFRRQKREQDFGDVLKQIDLKKFGTRYHYVSYAYSNMMSNKDMRELGMEIFKKAWDAFPSQRHYLIAQIRVADVWKTDEMYNYAKIAMLPQDGHPLTDPWLGIGNAVSYSSDGTITDVLTRLMEAVGEGERRAALIQNVRVGLSKSPDWVGGEAILSLLEAKSGIREPAVQRIEKLMAEKKIPSRQAIVIGQEFANLEGYSNIAMVLFEEALESPNNQQQQFSYHPGRKLAQIYAKVDRLGDARRTIYELLEKQDYSQYANNPGYKEYQELQNFNSAAGDMLKMGLPLDALSLYNRAKNDTARLDAAKRYGGTYYVRQIDEGIKKAKAAMTPVAVAKVLVSWVRTPGEEEASDTNNLEPLVDLMLSVQAPTMDKARIESLFQTAIDTVSRDKKNSLVLKQLELKLKRAATARNDVSVRIAKVLSAFARPGETAEDRQQAALQDVQNYLGEVALPELDPKKPDRSLSETTRNEFGLWLVARLALQSESEIIRSSGELIANRAISAARLHNDKSWLMAMLRERGNLALKAGEKDIAELYWSEMLDVILATRSQKRAVSSLPANRVRTVAVPAAAAP